MRQPSTWREVGKAIVFRLAVYVTVRLLIRQFEHRQAQAR